MNSGAGTATSGALLRSPQNPQRQQEFFEMPKTSSQPARTPRRIVTAMAALVILKVTAAVVWNYRNYLPPDFQVDFLRGRESYFFGAYGWSFYFHIVTGPFTLIAGLLLMSERLRQRLPSWHRLLGRAQVLIVLFALAPSGLWMALYAQAGLSGQLGFSALAIATAVCTAMGWRMAVARRFQSHRLWMTRSYVLLCSAVVIRLIGGLATVTVPVLWIDQWTPWISWLAPLAILELTAADNRQRLHLLASSVVRRERRSPAQLGPQLISTRRRAPKRTSA